MRAVTEPAVARSPRVAGLVAIALVAFAGNSLLCRAALAGGASGPLAFAAIRIGSGALALVVLLAVTRRDRWRALRGSRSGAAALFVYVVGFSAAYVALDAGAGALLLFGAVQLTMLGYGVIRGERPRPLEWLGIVVAIAGLVVLTAPGARAPVWWAAVAMVIAGVAWGIYSLVGRGSSDPLADTAGNFVRALVLTVPVALALPFVADGPVTPGGVVLAALSGAVTSGGGYALWYAVVPRLTRTGAALLQLLVPVLAAVLGVLLLGEAFGTRLGVAIGLVPGGVALAVLARRRA